VKAALAKVRGETACRFDMSRELWNHCVVSTMQTPPTMDRIAAVRLIAAAAAAAIAAALP
jgi:hypothetical protein